MFFQHEYHSIFANWFLQQTMKHFPVLVITLKFNDINAFYLPEGLSDLVGDLKCRLKQY